MNYFIVTGASKGLGKAICEGLLSPGNNIFCISRTKNLELIKEAKAKDCSLEYFEHDLADIEGLDALMANVFKRIPIDQIETICLINNAGTLLPIKPMHKCEPSELAQSMTINAIAPMVLTNLFAKHTGEIIAEKRVINISSGAGKKPYYGWSSYCGAKAAVDLFTRTISLEQKKVENPMKIISFAPGIMDTEMQQLIRSSSEDDFEQLERFKKFKEDGKLLTPEYVASKVITLALHDVFEDGGVVDVSDYEN